MLNSHVPPLSFREPHACMATLLSGGLAWINDGQADGLQNTTATGGSSVPRHDSHRIPPRQLFHIFTDDKI